MELSLVCVRICAPLTCSMASVAGFVVNDYGNDGRDIPEGVTATIGALSSVEGENYGKTHSLPLPPPYHNCVDVICPGSIADCRLAA